MGYYNI